MPGLSKWFLAMVFVVAALAAPLSWLFEAGPWVRYGSPVVAILLLVLPMFRALKRDKIAALEDAR